MPHNDERSFEDQEMLQGEVLAAYRRTALASGAMVHGFKNQLTVVLGHAQLALEALERGELPDRAGLEAVRRAATQGVEFSQQLLGLAQTCSSADTVFEPAPVLERVVGLAATMLPGPVQLDIEDDLVPLCGNPVRVEQCLVDLVLNARDALAGSHGTVVLGYRRVELQSDDQRAVVAAVPAGSYGVLSVTDDGPGMEPEVLSRASELFFTTKPRGEGSGVGLAVVRELAERFGGGLAIESTSGAGTTVALLLPTADVGRPSETESDTLTGLRR